MKSIFKIQPIGSLDEVTVNDGSSSLEYALGDSAITGKPMSFVGSSFSLKRLYAIIVFCALLVAVLLFQTLYLQLIRGNDYLTQSEGNRTDRVPIAATRGKIYDSNKKTLAENSAAFTLWIRKEMFTDEKDYSRRLSLISSTLRISEEELHSMLLDEQNYAGDTFITDTLTHEEAMDLMSMTDSEDWFWVEEGTRRRYVVDSPSFGHILGYTGALTKDEWQDVHLSGYQKNDRIGKSGLEKSYEQILRGYPGERRVEVDARGVEEIILEERPSKSGSDIVLNINSDLQKYIEEILISTAKSRKMRKAAVVVMNPNNGGVVALVSSPGFDPNVFSGRIDGNTYSNLVNDQDLPLFQRTISGQYPSGSTFKPVVASAALDAGVIDEHTSFLSTGGIRIGSFFFPDWKVGGHGVIDVKTALANSVNTFFYIIGGGYKDKQGLGLSRLMEAASKFGLGKQLGIDLPGEASGFLPSAKWKEETKGEPWYIGDTYHVSIGQGDILVTPLQVAVFTSAIANGGTLYSPEVVDYFISGTREQDIEPKVIRSEVASADSLKIVRQGLRMAVTSGSAKLLSSVPFEVAGKTGTAQGRIDRPNHAWFTGFAPYRNPEIVVTVLVEEGGEGSSIAVPLARDILLWWNQHKDSD